MIIEDRLSNLKEKLKTARKELRKAEESYNLHTRDWKKREVVLWDKTITRLEGKFLRLIKIKYLKDISVSLGNIDKYLSEEKGKMLGKINSLIFDSNALIERNERLQRGMK